MTSQTQKHIPKKVFGFTFQKTLKLSTSTPYQYALYQNATDKLYFAKILISNSSKAHTRLTNEYTNHQALLQLQEYLQTPHQTLIPGLYPKLYSQKNLTIMLSQWLGDAPNLHSLKNSQKSEQFISSINLLNQLTTAYKTSAPPLKIPTKPGWKLVLSSPAWFLRAVFHRPRYVLPLFKLQLSFLARYIYIFFQPAIQLAHRDLHQENILLDGNKSYLIDHEFTSLTVKHFDLATLITTQIQNEHLKDHLYYEIKNDTNASVKYYQALGLYTCMLHTSCPTKNQLQIEELFETVEFWKNLRVPKLFPLFSFKKFIKQVRNHSLIQSLQLS